LASRCRCNRFLRGPEHPSALDDEIKDILPWIPPELSAMSTSHRQPARTPAHLHRLLHSAGPSGKPLRARKHRPRPQAATCAIKAGAKIVSLGGFSSILIEGNFDQLPERHNTVFTTQYLTVAFIVQAIKKCAPWKGTISANQPCS